MICARTGLIGGQTPGGKNGSFEAAVERGIAFVEEGGADVV